MNKKAVSAIVTTTLLVGFVIAMGIVITLWMRTTVRGYVEEGESGIETEMICMNVKLQLEKKDGSTIYIKNNGDIVITGYTAVLYDENQNSQVFEHLATKIDSYGILEYPPTDDPAPGETLGEKSKVKIVPQITTESGSTSACNDQAIILQLE